MPDKQIVLAVSGASAVIYARQLLKHLLAAEVHVHLIISPTARTIIAQELSCADILDDVGYSGPLVTTYKYEQMNCRLASGSFITLMTHNMVICPCSVNTLAGVASGLCDNLIRRAAAVHLKEARGLILCVREMPVSQIDLTNMLKASQSGARICPLSPPFYTKPTTVQAVVDGAVAKILDLLGVWHNICSRWTPPETVINASAS